MCPAPAATTAPGRWPWLRPRGPVAAGAAGRTGVSAVRVGKARRSGQRTVTIVAVSGFMATPAAMATAAAIHGRRLASLKKSAGLSVAPGVA